MALIGWWPLDGNTEDYTVGQKHLSMSNITWDSGKLQQSSVFNGTTSYMYLASDAKYTLTSLSISTWIRLDETGSWMIFQRGGLSQNGAYYLYSDDNTNVKWSIFGPTGSRYDNIFAYTLSTGVWNHIIATYNEFTQESKLYINGNLVKTVSSVILGNGTYPIYIGSYAAGSYWLQGRANDIRLYSHDLSQKEVNDLYKTKVLHYSFNKDESLFYDGSGYKRNTLKNVDSPIWTSTSKNGTGAQQFDGISKKITLSPDPLGDNLPKDFTISLWTKGEIRPAEFTYILHRGSGTAIASSVIYIGVQNSGYFSFGINGAWTPGSTTITQDSNLWYHLVLRYQGTTVSGFINGALAITYTMGITNTVIGTYTSLGDSTISGSNRAYNGIIDDVQFYATGLTNDQILDMYQTRAKIDDQGNLYADEFIEDYEINAGLTLKQLFDDNNNISNGINLIDSNLDGRADGFSGDSYLSYSIENGKQYFTTISGETNYYNSTNYFVGTHYGGHKYYTRYDYDVKDNVNTSSLFIMLNYGSGNIVEQSAGAGLNNITGSTSAVYEANATGESYWKLYMSINSSINVPVGHKWGFGNVYHIRLTEIFGLGNEPSQSQMDLWYNDYISTRPKASGIIKTREFDEISNPTEETKIFSDKIKIKGKLQEA